MPNECLVVGKNWWTWPYVSTGIIKTYVSSTNKYCLLNITHSVCLRPYHFINGSSNKDTNITEIFQWSTSISSKSALTSITLPSTNTSSSRVHIFALSVTPAADAPGQTLAPVLAIKDAAFSSSRWEDVNGTRAQAVQVTLANVLPQSAGLSTNTSISSAHSIEISGPDITTISAGVVNRLVASDQARVDVLIFGGRSGTNATILVKDSNGRVIGTSEGWPVTPLRETWTADQDELWTHETPTWVCPFSSFFLQCAHAWVRNSGIRQSLAYCMCSHGSSRLGTQTSTISIHWGVYSVPAWVGANICLSSYYN